MRFVPILALVLLAGTASAEERMAEEKMAEEGTAEAIFAGGCFWCMEPPFDKVAGVVSTTSGYTGGSVDNPSYKQVSAGGTGHVEAVRVRYDPATVSYAALLEVYWRNVDPFDAGGQFCDRGDQYRAAIFPATPEQQRLAEESRSAVAERFGRPIATAIEPAQPFYPAEAYHQNYYRTNPLQYRFYRFTCGRDQRLAEVWDSSTAKAPLLPIDKTAAVR